MNKYSKRVLSVSTLRAFYPPEQTLQSVKF
jgi:hypothetical protein